jgi:hypothetical protein
MLEICRHTDRHVGRTSRIKPIDQSSPIRHADEKRARLSTFSTSHRFLVAGGEVFAG